MEFIKRNIMPIYCFFILPLFFSDMYAQSDSSFIKISKAEMTKGELKVKFKNVGRREESVPILNYRRGIDNAGMDKQFYWESGDTLFLNLQSQVNSESYSVRKSHPSKSSNGKLYYLDKKIKPGKSYSSSVKLGTVKILSVLVLKYDGNTWISNILNL